jgi:tetratricopeptide (TPR) repeat protein
MDKEPSEIVKLTERIAKDPKSKLFVPLAEEYKKAGDVEMAIYVLTEGLKNNPGYVTARSILGRLLFEKGDLDGSYKELEEVVKAIPDNLLSQRKLGDICILQNKPDEALRHYRLVLSLNPRDSEIASMISDIEAGRDVKTRIHLPVPQPSPAEEAGQETMQHPQAAPAQQPKAASVSPPAAALASRASRAEEPRTVKTPAAAAPVPRPAGEAEEEVEEVLVVESLDAGRPERKLSAAGLDFLSEQPQADTYASSAEEPVGTAFAPAEQVREGLTVSDELPAGLKETGTREEAAEQSDDFTTDTLAELYIAQGFFEKAIDIYERMLADKPDSRGLRAKLDRVRSMAAASAAPAEAQDYAPAAPAMEEIPTGFPATDEPQEFSRARPAFTDFEPQEYIPPKGEPLEEKTEKAHAAPKPPPASRKATIDRLETWLKNIKKEK